MATTDYSRWPFTCATSKMRGIGIGFLGGLRQILYEDVAEPYSLP